MHTHATITSPCLPHPCTYLPTHCHLHPPTPQNTPHPNSPTHPRRDLILAATSGEELVEVMEDLGALRVVPLLQALLFDS
jgi:hypothetical protein